MLFWEPQVESVKQYLSYELALKHPVRGKMGIPVAAMVTEVQSLPCVQDWITRFRHAEKKMFGHGTCHKTVYDYPCISDESWVFILAVLKEPFRNSWSEHGM